MKFPLKHSQAAIKFSCIMIMSFSAMAAHGDVNSKELVDEANSAFIVGATTTQQVESFFKTRALEYDFVTRDGDLKRAPEFQWSSMTASGYYVITIPHVKINWWLVSYENLRISVEIDKGVISKVVFEKIYTGL